MATEESSADERLQAILRRNPRYPREAYEFINEALAFTTRTFDLKGHVTGQQLCHGARLLAIEHFGFMARTVLNSWNVHRTDDFGNLVYILIEAELLRRAENDSIMDFHDIYDFEQVFDQEFKIELEAKS